MKTKFQFVNYSPIAGSNHPSYNFKRCRLFF
jgi:hypothetical protein